MTTLSMAATRALLSESVLGAAYRGARPFCPTWLDREDMVQASWEVCGHLSQQYRPQPGTPAEHYVRTAFPWALRRAMKRAGDTGRSPTVQVHSADQAHVQRVQDATAEVTDYATSAACAELLRVLPEIERYVLWLCAVEGLSLTQVATRLGLRKSTAYDAYHRALRLARAFWADAA